MIRLPLKHYRIALLKAIPSRSGAFRTRSSICKIGSSAAGDSGGGLEAPENNTERMVGLKSQLPRMPVSRDLFAFASGPNDSRAGARVAVSDCKRFAELFPLVAWC